MAPEEYEVGNDVEGPAWSVRTGDILASERYRSKRAAASATLEVSLVLPVWTGACDVNR